MQETGSWWLVYPEGQRLTLPNAGAARRLAQGRSKRHPGRWIALQQAPPHHVYGFDGGEPVETSASDVPAAPRARLKPAHREPVPPTTETPQLARRNDGWGCLSVVVFLGVWIWCTLAFGGLGLLLGWMPAWVLAEFLGFILLLAVLAAILLLTLIWISQ